VYGCNLATRPQIKNVDAYAGAVVIVLSIAMTSPFEFH